MRNGHLIYQDIAEPLHKDVIVETITVDKWFKEHPNPVLRKVLSAAILAGSFFMVHTTTFAETIEEDKWHQPISQPYFPKTRNYHSGESRFEVPRTIYLDDWFKNTEQPYFSKRRFYHTGESRSEIPRDILITDWFQPAQIPVKQKLRQLLGGEFRTEVVAAAEEITLDKWWRQTNEPIRQKLRQLLNGEFRTEVALSEVVTLDKWFQPTQQPRITKLRNVNFGQYKFELPREILLSDWWQRTSEPVRRIVQRLAGQYVRIDPIADDTQLNEWFQPASEPYFKKRRNYFTGETKFEVPRIILLSDWQGQSQELVRRKVIRLTGQSVRLDIIADDTQINEWFQPISQPFFTKIRNVFTGEFRFEIPREILLSDWWQQLPERNKQILSRLSGGEVRVEVISESVTLDKWEQPIQQPTVRAKSFAHLDLVQGVLFQEPARRPICLDSNMTTTLELNSFISDEISLISGINITLTMNSYVYEPCV